MNIIFFHRNGGRPRSLSLTHPLMLSALALTLLFIVSVSFFLGRQTGVDAALTEPAMQKQLHAKELGKQQAELARIRAQVQEKVDALAKRVGLMSAHVIRLDALGRRLTQMANIDEREFDFGKAPAQGGPEGDDQGVAAHVPDLTAMIDTLAADMQRREIELGVLENLILSRDLHNQINPDGRPVREGWVSSYFGARSDPFTGYTAYHKGIDFAGPAGSQVLAVAAGMVTWSRDRHGYGKMVEINHGNGYVTRYAHNERNLVQVGETVQKGQAIALMGSTGRATGPNLHFEVLHKGQQVNPLKFIGEAR